MREQHVDLACVQAALLAAAVEFQRIHGTRFAATLLADHNVPVSFALLILVGVSERKFLEGSLNTSATQHRH